MKKLIFSLCFLFLFCIKVDAKEIVINDILYNTESDIYGKGYYFDNSANSLYLDQYYGGSIKFDGELTIFLRSDNVIDNNDNELSLQANNLIIHGDGSLYIVNTETGIFSETLSIDRCKIYIESNSIGIENIGHEINLYEIELRIESNNVGIIGNEILNINGSTINIINSNIGISSVNQLEIYSFNNKIYIESNDFCLTKVNKLDLEETKTYLKSNNRCLEDKIITGNSDNQIYASQLNYDYNLIDEYNNYSNIKIANNEEISELLINDSYLIFEIDKSIIKNEIDNVETEGEYIENGENKNENIKDDEIKDETFNENSSNPSDEIIIENPNTCDRIKKVIVDCIISILAFCSSLFKLRGNHARG